jgi:hypothetical protein
VHIAHERRAAARRSDRRLPITSSITGKPIFRKYSATGTLVFERHIEGARIDVVLENQPTRWPRRRVQDREVPLVTPVVRAARVSPGGELWVSLGVPYTYVYNTDGDKIRTVQFSAAGIISPTSLVLQPQRTAAGDTRLLRVRSEVATTITETDLATKDTKNTKLSVLSDLRG